MEILKEIAFTRTHRIRVTKIDDDGALSHPDFDGWLEARALENGIGRSCEYFYNGYDEEESDESKIVQVLFTYL